MNHNVRSQFLVLACAFASAASLSAATFTYFDGSDGNIEVYTSVANMQAGTQSPDTGAYTGGGTLSGFGSVAFDGSEYRATFGSFLITYSSLSNMKSDTRVSTANLGFTGINGLATGDGNLFWLIFGSNTLIPYSTSDRLASNTQGLSTEGGSSQDDNITTTWNTSFVTGFGSDGNDFYVVRNVDGTDNDILTVHDTIEAVSTDTRLSTTIIDAGAGGTVPALLSGAGLAVTPVPEPATYGLISGFLLLATAHFRRRNRR